MGSSWDGRLGEVRESLENQTIIASLLIKSFVSKKSVILYPEYGHEGIKGASDTAFEFLSDL